MVPVGVRRFRLAGKRGECAMSFMCRSKSMGTGRSNVTDKPISVLLRNSWYKYPPATVRKRPGRLICHPVHSFSEPSRMSGIALCVRRECASRWGARLQSNPAYGGTRRENLHAHPPGLFEASLSVVEAVPQRWRSDAVAGGGCERWRVISVGP